MSDLSNVAFLVFGIVAIFLIHYFVGKFDRQRIREHLEANGGTVISIERPWFSGGKYFRTYTVLYKARNGKTHVAKCLTSMTRGVDWLNSHPPGSVLESFADAGSVESIECLECGAKVPAGKMRCPHCGWSYKR